MFYMRQNPLRRMHGIRHQINRITAKWKRWRQRRSPFVKWKNAQINRTAFNIIQRTCPDSRRGIAYTIKLIRATQSRRAAAEIVEAARRTLNILEVELLREEKLYKRNIIKIDAEFRQTYLNLIQQVGRANADKIVKEIHQLDWKY